MIENESPCQKREYIAIFKVMFGRMLPFVLFLSIVAFLFGLNAAVHANRTVGFVIIGVSVFLPGIQYALFMSAVRSVLNGQHSDRIIGTVRYRFEGDTVEVDKHFAMNVTTERVPVAYLAMAVVTKEHLIIQKTKGEYYAIDKQGFSQGDTIELVSFLHRNDIPTLRQRRFCILSR